MITAKQREKMERELDDLLVQIDSCPVEDRPRIGGRISHLRIKLMDCWVREPDIVHTNELNTRGDAMSTLRATPIEFKFECVVEADRETAVRRSIELMTNGCCGD